MTPSFKITMIFINSQNFKVKILQEAQIDLTDQEFNKVWIWTKNMINVQECLLNKILKIIKKMKQTVKVYNMQEEKDK